MKKFILKHLFGVDLDEFAAEQRRAEHLLGQVTRERNALQAHLRELQHQVNSALRIVSQKDDALRSSNDQLLSLWARAHDFLPDVIRAPYLRTLGLPEHSPQERFNRAIAADPEAQQFAGSSYTQG